MPLQDAFNGAQRWDRFEPQSHEFFANRRGTNESIPRLRGGMRVQPTPNGENGAFDVHGCPIHDSVVSTAQVVEALTASTEIAMPPFPHPGFRTL
jgi:hypothetical protein